MICRRTITPVLGLAALLVGQASGASQAAPVYQALVGPRWANQTTVGAGRQLDCRASNLYFGSDACALDLKTPAGCYYEILTATGATVERRAPSPGCVVQVQGLVRFHRAGGACHLTAPQSLLVTYTTPAPHTSTPMTTHFQASAVFKPKSFYDPFGVYVRQMQVTLSGGSTTSGFYAGGVGAINETFVATFVSPLPPNCPSADAPDTIAYLRDTAGDFVGTNPGAAGAVTIAYDQPIAG